MFQGDHGVEDDWVTLIYPEPGSHIGGDGIGSEYDGAGAITGPKAVIERGVIMEQGVCADHNSVAEAALSVHQRLGEGRGDGDRRAIGEAHLTGSCFRPLQENPWSVTDLGSKEPAVEVAALFGEDIGDDLDAGILEHFDATTGDTGIRVDRAYHYPTGMMTAEEFGAGGSFAIVRARLESDIESGEGQQVHIGIRHRSYGIDLGMRLSESAMISLADHSAIRGNNQCPHHRVGGDMAGARHSEAKGPTHILFICSHKKQAI